MCVCDASVCGGIGVIVDVGVGVGVGAGVGASDVGAGVGTAGMWVLCRVHSGCSMESSSSARLCGVAGPSVCMV